MTVILDDIRRLDAAYARGEISADDLVAAKSKLMDSVPDADDIKEHVQTEPEHQPLPPKKEGVAQTLLFCMVIMLICVGAALFLTGDIMLSLTLAITVLAAFTVMLFRQLDG